MDLAKMPDDDDAPLPPAAYEEVEELEASVTKTTEGELELINDDESPVSPDSLLIDATKEEMKEPDNLSDTRSANPRDHPNPSGNTADESAEIRPPPPSMMPNPDDAESTVPSAPIIFHNVEATLVPPEPDAQVIDAVAVRTNGEQSPPSWWRGHQRLIFFSILAIVLALVAIVGASLLTQQENDDGANAQESIEQTPSPLPSQQVPIVENMTTRPPSPKPVVPLQLERSTDSPSMSHPSNPPHKEQPTKVPSSRPTQVSTAEPIVKITEKPTLGPTEMKAAPTPTRSPTIRPTSSPSVPPTPMPTSPPTWSPESTPVDSPTLSPVAQPTEKPSFAPTKSPTKRPTDQILSSAVPLTAIDAIISHQSQSNIAIHGNTAVVGAPMNIISEEHDRYDKRGAAFVLVKGADGQWLQQAKLIAPDGGSQLDSFGHCVDIHGDFVIVGERQDDDNGLDNSGAVHVYIRNGNTWAHQQKLFAPDGAHGDGFGETCAIFEQTAVVGVPRKDGSRGAVYVFVRNGSMWAHQQKLEAPDIAPDGKPGKTLDSFGMSVSIHKNTVVVGREGDDVNQQWGVRDDYRQGSAHIFVRNGVTWTHQAKLLAPDGADDDRFGHSSAIHENTVIIGTHRGGVRGVAHVFVRDGTSWSHQAKLLPPNEAAKDDFGRAVAIHGDSAVVGAPLNDDNGYTSGAAHLFVRKGTNWNHRVKLVSPNIAAQDYFGNSLAVYNSTAIVHSPGLLGKNGYSYAFSGISQGL